MADFAVSVRLKRLRIKEGELLAPGSSVYIAAERAGRAAVKHAQDELIQAGAVDSGSLYNSMDYEIFRQGKSVVISVGPLKGSDHTKKVARYVEYGTKSPIPAAGPKKMPIKIKGGPTIIRMRVKGQEPKHYLRNALRKVDSGDFYG